jgi:hypothetical protein
MLMQRFGHGVADDWLELSANFGTIRIAFASDVIQARRGYAPDFASFCR